MNAGGSSLKKIIQVSEEVQNPKHVPIILGNECYIITEQDVRKIKDLRLITYHKLTANGELIPMEKLGHDHNIRETILNACNNNNNMNNIANIMTNGAAMDNLANLNAIAQLLARSYVSAQTSTPMDMGNCNNIPAGAMSMPQPTVASIEQQVQWNKFGNSCAGISPPMFPLHHTTATSTSEISPETSRQQRCCCCCCCCCCKSESSKIAGCSQGSNTMDTDYNEANTNENQPCRASARELLKQRKKLTFNL